ncbi:MAG TPA: hypothetical protein K8U80_06740 [Collinsella ihuae]|uniref:Uncharacterized protein n=1 Tax=Collinsella ihumii TaxID=1720204 RepID=A0A921LTA3_9ACTN|nr:hypothetical protein [Collinsella ihumii]
MERNERKESLDDLALDGLGTLYQSNEEEGRVLQRLKMHLNDLKIKETFKVGDIVMWKGGMKNRNFPEYHTPAIVVDCFDPPIMDPEPSAGSQYYREPLDVRLGFIAEDDSFVTFLYDSRRFERYEEQSERMKKRIATIKELLKSQNV